MAEKPRRAKGSGHKNEARQRWETRVTVGVKNGKQVRRKITGRTKDEMEARKREVLAALEDGRELQRRDLTVERFLTDWLENILPGTVAVATEAQYRQTARLYIIPAIGTKHLRTLQPRDVTIMMREMAKRGLSPNSQRLARAVLRRALRQAEVDGSVTRNVAKLADAPKAKKKEGKALTADEARSLLTYLENHRHSERPSPDCQCTIERMEAAITVALSLGLRRGELLGLSWSDIDLGDTPRLTVRVALKRHEGVGLVLEEPKTDKSRRSVRLPAPTVAALKRHRVRQSEERLAAGDLWEPLPLDADLVFRTEFGLAIDPNNFGAAVRRACRDAGIEGTWSPHSLRHSAATLLLAQGVPLKTISEVLGHSSIKVTSDVYAHLLDEAKAEAADAMSKALWG